MKVLLRGFFRGFILHFIFAQLAARERPHNCTLLPGKQVNTSSEVRLCMKSNSSPCPPGSNWKMQQQSPAQDAQRLGKKTVSLLFSIAAPFMPTLANAELHFCAGGWPPGLLFPQVFPASFMLAGGQCGGHHCFSLATQGLFSSINQ